MQIKTEIIIKKTDPLLGETLVFSDLQKGGSVCVSASLLITVGCKMKVSTKGTFGSFIHVPIKDVPLLIESLQEFYAKNNK